MIRGSCCSKSSLAKAAGAEVAAEQSYEKWHAAVVRSTFVREMYKTPQRWSHFGSCDLQNWHAAVARSTFSSQNAQNTTFPEPFWKL